MKIFIFPFIANLTTNYHSQGGAVVIDQSQAGAVKRLEAGGVGLSGKEEIIAYELKDNVPESMFIFPNSGCC